MNIRAFLPPNLDEPSYCHDITHSFNSTTYVIRDAPRLISNKVEDESVIYEVGGDTHQILLEMRIS